MWCLKRSSSSFSSTGFLLKNTPFLSPRLSPAPLSLHPHLSNASTHPSDSPSGQRHLGSHEIQECGNQRESSQCVCARVCVFVDTVCEYTSCAPGLLFSSFAKGLKSAWMIYFRMCKVLGIIIFSEIKKSIKAVSCPRAEIVALWMHVLCPVNMICGLCFKVLPASFFFPWLSSLFKAGGPKYLNSN